MSSTLQNSPIGAQDGLPRLEKKDVKPKSSNASLRSDSVSNTPNRDSPRGRSAWKAGTNDYLDGLRALPEVRPIPWAPGKELPPDKSTHSTRTQTRGAFLLATRGSVRNPPCGHCATGVGRFLHCISLDNWFHGACATCQMGTRGNLCTLRTDVEGTSSETKLKPNKLESPSLSYSSPTPQPESSLKRKRATLGEGMRAVSAGHYTSPYATVPNGTPYQQISPYTNSPSTFTPPPNYAPDDPTAPVNYIYKKQNPLNGIKPPQAIAQAAPRQPELSIPGSAFPHGMYASEARAIFKEMRENNETDYEAYVANKEKAKENANQNKAREPSTSLSPSAQLLDAQYARKETRGPGERAVSKSESRNNEPATTSLIDTLPRKKQKQIFGIIGGLQSGIRNARQQADGLQKQLDLLQAALGIDGEEEDGDP